MASFRKFEDIEARQRARVLNEQLNRVRYRNHTTEPLFYELYAIAEEIKNKIIALVNHLKRSPLKGVKYKN